MLTHVSFKEILYPVYKLSDNSWYDIADDQTMIAQCPRTGAKAVVDPRSQEGDTLVRRRLNFIAKPTEGVKLATLSTFYKNRMDHTLYGATGRYIDSKGKAFYWEKSRYATLFYYKIKKIVKAGEGVLVISLIGIDKTIVTRYPPPVNYKWAALLLLEGGALLYGYSTEKNVKKKI